MKSATELLDWVEANLDQDFLHERPPGELDRLLHNSQGIKVQRITVQLGYVLLIVWECTVLLYCSSIVVIATELTIVVITIYTQFIINLCQQNGGKLKLVKLFLYVKVRICVLRDIQFSSNYTVRDTITLLG